MLFRSTRKSAGTLTAIDTAAGRLWLKRAKRRTEAWPRALLAGPPVDDAVMRRALTQVATQYLDQPDAPSVARALLRGDRPSLRGGPPGTRVQTMDPAQQGALVKALDHSYLVVQGPPGSGKTYLAGRLIAALLRDGYRVGVSSLSHKAINHVLTSVERELGGHKIGRAHV